MSKGGRPVAGRRRDNAPLQLMTRDSLLITHHPYLITLRRRVRGRWLLHRLRVGLLWALAGDALIAAGGRTAELPGWPLATLVWTVLSLLAAVAIALQSRPNGWMVALAADSFGLSERVTSAIHAARVGDPAAQLLAEDAARALSRIDPSDYPLLPDRRLRKLETAALLGLTLALFLPMPALGYGQRRAADARSVTAARESVKTLEARLAAATPEPLVQAAAEDLRAAEQRLAEARTAEEVARVLEQTQEQLAGRGQAEDYAWQRAMESLSSLWRDSRSLSAVARALRAGDQGRLEQTLADLAQRSEGMDPEEKQELRLGLQAGANAVRDIPDLAGALRQASSQAGRSSSPDAIKEGAAPEPMSEVASLLGQGMSRSAGLQAMQQAMAGLGQARGRLGAVAGSAGTAGATASTGPASGSGSGGQVGAGQGAQAGSGTGSGSGAGPGSGAGDGSGSGSGTGPGTGAGSGSGSGSGGAGGAGSGAGAGAGAGGEASSGRPGSGSAGVTSAGGGAAPSLRGTTNYDPVYAPELLGGSGGPTIKAPGEAQGASGETVELPNSPLELGSVRPYDEVYGRYEAAARQSLSRQPLPPSLQSLVQRYFSAIAPASNK